MSLDLVVILLTFYSEDPISNPDKVYSFSGKKMPEKNECKQKEVGADFVG